MDPHNTDVESSNVDNVEARPFKKAKCEQMDDCDLSLSPSSPATVLSLPPVSSSESDKEMKVIYSDNIQSDTEMNDTRDSESEKMMNDKSVVSVDNKEDQSESDQQMDGEIVLLDHDNQLEEHVNFKVDQTYDYLPQGIFCSNFPEAILSTCYFTIKNIYFNICRLFNDRPRLLCSNNNRNIFVK